MAVKTIQIADKPTLDETKALLENGEYGLSAIKSAVDSGLSGGSAGGLQIEKYIDEPVSACVSVSTLPSAFYGGAAVVLDNEIHILGGGSGNYKKHYKYNGSSWESVSTLPFSFSDGAAVVLDNEIHILGSNVNSSDYKKHYKYNGSSWESVSTLPYEFRLGSAIVYNNEIHILGGMYSDSYKKHYKYNGSSWESVSTLPFSFSGGAAVIYNNRIYIFGGISSNSTYTEWGSYGSSSSNWSVHGPKLPYDFYDDGSAVVFKNTIHILGGSSDNVHHYKLSVTNSWVNVSTLPYSIPRNFAVVYGNDIHIFNGTRHYVVKSDNRRIATMLPKGTHIMLSDNEDINYVSNATKVSNNIAEVTETGYVEVLAALPEPDNIKGYLTFY